MVPNEQIYLSCRSHDNQITNTMTLGISSYEELFINPGMLCIQ